MRISQLRAFLAAADHGSFTAGARALNVAQPTVSDLVRGLEAECGMALFVRGPRAVTLTSAGSDLLPWARRAVESVAGAEQVARAMRGLEGGTVHLGVMRNGEFYFLSDVARRFHQAHPQVRLRLVGQNSVSVADAVRLGDLEAGIVVLPVPTHGLQVHPVYQDEVVWVSPDPRRVAQPMTIDLIGRAPVVLYDASAGWADPTRAQLQARANAHGTTLAPAIEVEHVESALALVERGLGETMVARAVAASRAFPPGLHVTGFADPLYDVIALVIRQGAQLSPATQTLVSMVTEVLRRRAGAGGSA